MKVVTIGRSKEHNDIVVNDEKVSRNHLQMIMDDNGNYSVQDLNSTNGTFVNGRRISGQVPLKVTDELRIGNTVLSWQCYFGSQPNAGTSNPVPPQVAIPPVPSVSPKQPIVEPPTPKRWLIYILIGAVVLLASGGGIGWKIYHDKQQKKEALVKQQEDEAKKKEEEKKEEEAKRSQENAEFSLKVAEDDAAEAWKKFEDADADAKKWEEKARNTQSEKDREIAQLKRDNAEALKKAAEKAKKELEELNKKYQQELQKKDDEVKKVKADQSNTKKTLELTNQMQEILNSWGDEKTVKFCKKKGWPTKNARTVINNHFSSLSDNAKKQQMIDEMKEFKEERNPKQTETKSTADSQPSPSDNSTTSPSSTSQPATTEPQQNSNN